MVFVLHTRSYPRASATVLKFFGFAVDFIPVLVCGRANNLNSRDFIPTILVCLSILNHIIQKNKAWIAYLRKLLHLKWSLVPHKIIILAKVYLRSSSDCWQWQHQSSIDVQLELLLDDNLSFDRHINHMKKLVRPFISLMWFIPIEKRVHCHLSYMLPIYGDCSSYKIDELQVIQNKCIKAMYQLPRDTPSTYLYSSGLLPISQLAYVVRVTNIHRMVDSFAEHKFNFVTNFDVYGRVTRQGHYFHTFRSKGPFINYYVTQKYEFFI